MWRWQDDAGTIGNREPLIARLGGLPADSVAGFASGALAGLCDARAATLEELARCRAELSERLHACIPASPPPERRFLLAVRRDCWNGRGLGRHLGTPQAAALHRLTAPLPARLAGLEEQLARGDRELAAAYAEERQREGRHLRHLLDHRGLSRGIALASPVLAAQLGRLRAGSGRAAAGRRVERLELSLVRYLSRAALKTSPYSTLTRIGLGRVVSGAAGAAAVRLPAGRWQERSLLRLRRFVLDQIRDLLLRYAPFRASLSVALNSSLVELAPGYCCLLRPGFWEPDAERRSLGYVQDSLVKVRVDTPLATWLRAELTRPRPWPRLCAEVAGRCGPPGAGSPLQELEGLIDLGLLRLEMPWPSNEPQLERRLAAHLASLPPDPDLTRLIGGLTHILELESGYPEAAEPLLSLEAIGREVEETFQAAVRLAGLAGPPSEAGRLRRGHPAARTLYEDVLLLPRAAAGGQRRERGQEIAELSAESLDQVLRSVEPLVGLAHLFSRRHDFLHAVAELMARQWPGRAQVPLLELFAAARPLWREYCSFLQHGRRTPDGWRSAFDPFRLPAVEELNRLRESIWSARARWVAADGPDVRISVAGLAGLLAAVPERYAPPVGPCLFLQPADAAGRLWVLNKMYEGTGRFGSRYTAAMPPAARRRYAAHLGARSQVEHGGERLQLLDLLAVQGDTLNVHAVQTQRVLDLPGEAAATAAAQRLGLRQLWVRAASATGLPRVVDEAGRPLLPAHLGTTGHAYVPVLVKFLWLFGAGEVLSVFPPRPARREAGVESYGRLLAGNVVLVRRRWVLGEPALPFATVELTDAQAFAALDLWRRRHGLPGRIFVIEKIADELDDDLHKPQFVDFSSPLLVEVFRSILRTARRSSAPLLVEEVLPLPETQPRDGEGTPWVVELLVDTLALRPAGVTVRTTVSAGVQPAAVQSRDQVVTEPYPAY